MAEDLWPRRLGSSPSRYQREQASRCEQVGGDEMSPEADMEDLVRWGEHKWVTEAGGGQLRTGAPFPSAFPLYPDNILEKDVNGGETLAGERQRSKGV